MSRLWLHDFQITPSFRVNSQSTKFQVFASKTIRQKKISGEILRNKKGMADQIKKMILNDVYVENLFKKRQRGGLKHQCFFH